MNTLRRFSSTVALTIFVLATSLAAPSSARAGIGIGKWFENEFVPTVTGERPLEIKPYVSIKHKEQLRIQLSPDALHVEVLGVTVKTHQLTKRLAQAGCVIETGGNVVACAPDIVQRELQKLASETRATAAQPSQGAGPGAAVPSTPPQGSVGTISSMGWATGWTPQIAVHCRFNDGMVVGVSAGGWVHAATPEGYSAPVGTIRGSFNPAVRFVLQNGRGNEAPVLQDGRVLDQSATHVVGFCR